MEQFKKTVAQNLTALRKENQYTQLQLAELLHYSDKAVSKWERGESLPDIFVLKKIADLYHVSLDDLVMTAEEREARAAEDGAAEVAVEDAGLQMEEVPMEDVVQPMKAKASQRTRAIIAGLAAMLIWLIATSCFVGLDIFAPDMQYTPLTFLYALPVTAVIWLVFNSIWFNRRWNYVIISILVWSVLLSLYITFLPYNIWKIFYIGIPAQAIIILWSRLHPSKKQNEIAAVQHEESGEN